MTWTVETRDGRWMAVALNVSSLFGCGFVQQKKIIIPHSGAKIFFWISLLMGHKWWQHILIEKEMANKNEQFKAIATSMYLVRFIWQQTTFTQTQIE